MKRIDPKLPFKRKQSSGGRYFTPAGVLRFIPTGSTLLDLVLGGGVACGRMFNIVGDSSSGKTLAMIELAANYRRIFPKGPIAYRETEAAFDKSYAQNLGMPVDSIDFGKAKLETVEELYNDCVKFCAKAKTAGGGLYILDSMDALSDQKEMASEFGEASYGTAKAKALSQLFRRLTRVVEDANVAFCIVSQVRSNIGVTFGDKFIRAGGKALDFYATHILVLAQMGKLKKTINGVTREIGVQVRARCKKNKIGKPFRECQFQIIFEYGVEDIASCVNFLEEVKQLKRIGIAPKDKNRFIANAMKTGDLAIAAKVRKATRKAWRAIEKSFLPPRKKYA